MSLYTATNIRLGFATNSSSSHSVVLGPGQYQAGEMSPAFDFGFGWEGFCLDDAGSRVAYLAAGVLHSLKDLPDYQAKAVLKEMFAGTPLVEPMMEAASEKWTGIYIDHQSAFTLPNPQSEHFPQVFREAMEFFMDDRVTICGGNDNGDDETRGPFTLGPGDYAPIRIRRDGDCYVLMNWQSGAKVRIAPEGSTFTKATRPELVDLKITDACPYRCEFCYQGSTPAGSDGDRRKIGALIEALGVKHLGAFEVAIGGGEPTASDLFVDTIKACVAHYIRPNFTTFAVDWLLDDAKVAAANLCGGIGVSIHSAKDWAKVDKIAARVKGPQVMGQHVFGSLDQESTVKLIAAGKDKPLLLLGFKPVGFGADKKPFDLSTLFTDREYGRRLNPYDIPRRLSVDTAFAQLHPWFLKAIEANSKSYSVTEGAFSMYVDAVTGRIGPSSYCDRADLTPLPSLSDRHIDGAAAQYAYAIGKAFQSYPGKAQI